MLQLEAPDNGRAVVAVLLAQPDRQLPLRLGHLAPQLVEIGLQRLIAGIFPQSQREPAIRRRQIARRAQAGRIERPHFDHCLRITLIHSRLQQPHAPLAILPHALAVDISLRPLDRIGSGKRRVRLGQRLHW